MTFLNDAILAAIVGAAATLVVGALSFFQWLMSNRVRARARDRELYEWGAQTIQIMAKIERLAQRLEDLDPPPGFSRQVDGLIAEASAQVDVGRLFFPNVQTRGFDREGEPNGPAAYRGSRVAILDEVVRAYYVARYLREKGPARDDIVGWRMRDARRRFVSLLQREMGRSLKKSSPAKAGEHMSEDPHDW